MINELRQKISEIYINEKFIGNYFFTKQELTLIYQEVSHIFRSVSIGIDNAIKLYDYELVFVALVNLAREWNYGDEAYFNYVYKTLLGNSCNIQKLYLEIQKVIDKLKNQNKIFMLDSFTKKYYATICSHAFAPISSMESFFDLCWEIYTNDLDQEYGKNDPVFNQLAESLSRYLRSVTTNEEKEFQLGSKFYAFRAGIRGLADGKTEILKVLLDNVLESIHSLLNGYKIDEDKYLNKLIKNWWQTKESQFGITKILKRKNYGHIITEYSNIKAKYVYDRTVKIVIPPIRLVNDYDIKPKIEISMGDNVIYTEIMSTKGSGVIMSTELFEYDLCKIDDINNINVNIKIKHLNSIIYDSEKSLYRDFILFGDNGKEILSQNCMPGYYLIFMPELSSLMKYPSEIRKSGRYLYNFCSYDNELIQGINKTVFFKSENSINQEVYFYKNEIKNAIYHFNSEEYLIIDGEMFVEVSKEYIVKEIGIRIDSAVFRLSDFDYKIIVESNKFRFLISSIINNGEPIKISLFRYSDNEIIDSINIIKFNNIKISYDKEIYFGDINTGVFNFSSLEINLSKKFLIYDDMLSVDFKYNNYNGEIVFSPPILKWRIDDSEWRLGPLNSYLWYEDLSNTSILKISAPEYFSYIVGLTDNSEIFPKNKLFDYRLGETIYQIKHNKSLLSKSLTLFVRSSEDDYYKLAEIYFYEDFVDDPIYVYPYDKQVIWMPDKFIGNKNCIFQLDVFLHDSLVYTKKLDRVSEKIDFSYLNDDKYNFKISIAKNLFLKKNYILYEREFIIGDYRIIKYNRKVLKLKAVMYFDEINVCNIRQCYYIRNIRYAYTEEGRDIYSGSIYILKEDNIKFYLNKLKDFSDNYVKINPIMIEFKSDDSCYLGYGFNYYDRDYDDEFTIDKQGKITIGKQSKIFGKTNKSVDYFIFEVKDDV